MSKKTTLHSKYLLGVDLWLVAPKGAEEYTTAVLADSADSAVGKASRALEQFVTIKDKSDCTVLNITRFFAKSGYDIIVAQKDTFH